jgi:hypothetical protein
VRRQSHPHNQNTGCNENEDALHVLLKYLETSKWRELLLSIKWRTVNEEVAYKRIVNCTVIVWTGDFASLPIMTPLRGSHWLVREVAIPRYPSYPVPRGTAGPPRFRGDRNSETWFSRLGVGHGVYSPIPEKN